MYLNFRTPNFLRCIYYVRNISPPPHLRPTHSTHPLTSYHQKIPHPPPLSTPVLLPFGDFPSCVRQSSQHRRPYSTIHHFDYFLSDQRVGKRTCSWNDDARGEGMCHKWVGGNCGGV